MQAIEKLSLMPAQRLEARVPSMKNKGRIRVGADADLVLFDPETVIDRATYEEPDLPSAGIAHVLVAGQFVVRDGAVLRMICAAAFRAAKARGNASAIFATRSENAKRRRHSSLCMRREVRDFLLLTSNFLLQ